MLMLSVNVNVISWNECYQLMLMLSVNVNVIS